MEILIDNKDLKEVYGIMTLDHTQALGIASERVNERTWADKSGVDKNISNIRYDSKDFSLSLICKSTTYGDAYLKVKSLTDYMFSKGVFVLSIRDLENGLRVAFLCERSNDIVPSINIREQNSLYVFKIGLKDVNPNALVYYTTIEDNEVNINYTKGRNAFLYWGDGSRGEVSNSGTYTKSDYTSNGLVDVIIDIDKDVTDTDALTCDFEADITSGIKSQDVQFTDLSTGDIVLWSWDFGDGLTSSEQSPLHTYSESGTYDVSLQIFNITNGSQTTIKMSYIVVRNARMLVNDSGDFALKNNSDYGLIN